MKSDHYGSRLTNSGDEAFQLKSFCPLFSNDSLTKMEPHQPTFMEVDGVALGNTFCNCYTLVGALKKQQKHFFFLRSVACVRYVFRMCSGPCNTHTVYDVLDMLHSIHTRHYNDSDV